MKKSSVHFPEGISDGKENLVRKGTCRSVGPAEKKKKSSYQSFEKKKWSPCAGFRGQGALLKEKRRGSSAREGTSSSKHVRVTKREKQSSDKTHNLKMRALGGERGGFGPSKGRLLVYGKGRKKRRRRETGGPRVKRGYIVYRSTKVIIGKKELVKAKKRD